jgi:hypothetical protein
MLTRSTTIGAEDCNHVSEQVAQHGIHVLSFANVTEFLSELSASTSLCCEVQVLHIRLRDI